MPIWPCYLDCHEAGQCCYLVIHTENLLSPLQLFTSIFDVFTDSPSYKLWLLFLPSVPPGKYRDGNYIELGSIVFTQHFNDVSLLCDFINNSQYCHCILIDTMQ
jgi:hypothetical protein